MGGASATSRAGRRRRAARLARLALGVIATLAPTATAPAAQAHAYLVRAVPANGQQLSASPRVVRLWFSETIARGLSRVELVRAGGGRVRAELTGRGDPWTLVVRFPALPRGAYRLDVRAVSETDLHVTRSALVFGVGAPAAAAATALRPPATATPGIAESGLRVAAVAALCGLAGAIAVLLLLPATAEAALGRARRHLLALALASAAAGLASGVGLVALQARATGSGLGPVVVDTTFGRVQIARVLVLASLAAAIVALRHRPAARTPAIAAAALVCALASTSAAGSHAAAAHGLWSTATLVLAVHVLAAGIWVGGLVAAGIALGPGLAAGGASAAVARQLLARFGRWLAAPSVAALALTGLYEAGVDVPTLGGLRHTDYGHVLLLKLALAVAAGMAAARTAWLVRGSRGAPGRRLRRAVGVEAALAGTVLVPAALLTALAPPPAPPAPASPVAPVPALVTARAGDLLLVTSVRPNRPGPNFLAVGVFDTRRPAPAPIGRVTVALRRADGRWQTYHARPAGARQWVLSGHMLDRAGPWTIRVRVDRAGLPPTILTRPWALALPAVRPARPPAAARGTRLAPVLNPLAGALALALAAGLLLAGARRRAGEAAARGFGGGRMRREQP